jgi:hypothetical protein
MHFSKMVSVFILLALAFAGSRAYTQASVTENQTTYVYVNASTGSNSNSGSSSSPLKTIQAAVNKANTNNQKKIGTKIIVESGVYRESVVVNPVYAGSTVPLTIQASATGGAVIAGSDVLTGWTSVSGHPYTYYHSWNYNFGYCPVPSGWPSNFPSVARRTEMIVVNGISYAQVMSESQLRAGTFFVDEATNQILVTVPSSTSIYSATVEAAVRDSTITVNSRSNVVLRGLVFRHGRTCINQSAANINGSSEVLLDRVQANWNAWGGLAVNSSSHITVQNSIASHNGGVGFQGFRDQYALFSYDESDFNNWRGAQGGLYNWGMGGTKLMQMRNTTVQDHYSYGNQAQGLWLDTDNKNVTINNATVAGSIMSALQLEANEGPVTVENSHLCTSLAGVTLLNQEKLTMKNTAFYDNGGFGQYPGEIFVAGRAGGHVIYDWQSGQYYNLYTSGTVLSGNDFENATSGQHVFGTYLSGGDWSDFANSLDASGNRWYDPSTSYSFMLPSAHLVNFSGWKSAVGTDYSSSWASSSLASACAIPGQSYTDFSASLDRQSYAMSAGHVAVGVKVANYGYGAVSLSVSGLPSNVSGSFSRSSLSSGIVTLTLSASKYAANQTVPITIWASSGSRVHPVTVNVHIVPA